MDKEKLSEIYIKPENRLPEEQINKCLSESKKSSAPVVEMHDGKVMPVYMFGGALVIRSKLGNANMDIMMTLMHHVESDKIELRGRIRYETTGRKTVFNRPEMFDLKDYEDARQEVRNMYLQLIKETPIKPLATAWELEFKIGETTENIIKKMEASNHFNIGIVPTK